MECHISSLKIPLKICLLHRNTVFPLHLAACIFVYGTKSFCNSLNHFQPFEKAGIISLRVTSKAAICQIFGYDRTWVSYLQQGRGQMRGGRDLELQAPVGLIQAGKKFFLASGFQERRSMRCCEEKRAWDLEPGGLNLSIDATNANYMSSCALFNFSLFWIFLWLLGLNKKIDCVLCEL